MSMKRCMVCGEPFQPHPRTRRFQKACGKPACRKRRKHEADRRWRSKNSDYGASRRGKLRQWAAAYPDYWRHWRATHPGYTKRNREQSLERMRRSRLMFAKQDAIRCDPIGYLEGLRVGLLFAKQDAIARPIEGILSYLVAREVFAKPNGIA